MIRSALTPRSAIALLAAAAVLLGACSSGVPPAPSPSPGASTGHPGGRTAFKLELSPAGYTLPAPVQREVAVVDGATVYLAGGLDSTATSTSTVFALDSGTGKATRLGKMPQAFHDAAGALIGGQIFVFGGGAARTSDVVQSFDPQTGKGRIVGHLPKAISDLAAAAVSGTVYLVGGYDGHTAQATIYSTTDGMTFKAAGRLPVGLRYAAVTVSGTRLIIAGGFTDRGPVDSVYVFDTSTGKVSILGKLPVPLGHSAALALGGRIYVIGGLDSAGTAVGSVSAIRPSSGRVMKLHPLRQAVSDAAVAAVPTGALLLGGWRGSYLGTGLALDQVLQATLKAVHHHLHPSATPSGPATPSASPRTSAPAAAATRSP